MNQRFLSVLAFAFLVAAGASLLLYRLISSRVTASAGPATSQVMLAARNLEIGTLLRESDLKTGDWAGTLPKGAVLRKDDVIGRGVVASIYEGEPILDTRLAPKGAGAGLAATIPAGMRAVAVRVNDVVGVAGFVVPGMRVDLIISGTPPGASGAQGTLTRTLLQSIEVLSAGQNIQKDAEGKPVSVQVVNLLVTPEQAEILSLASNETRIQLVLRNPLDTEVAKTPGTAMSRLFTNSAPPPPKAEPRPRTRIVKVVEPVEKEKPLPQVSVEIIQGAKRVETKFQAEGR